MSVKFTIILFVLSSLIFSMSCEPCSKLLTSQHKSILNEMPSVVSALTTRQKTADKDNADGPDGKRIESFQCPRIFDSKQREWCCNSNTPDAHCCVWRERAKQMTWAEYQSMIIVVLLFAAAFLIMFLFCLIVAIKLHEQAPHTRYSSNCPYESEDRPATNSSAPSDDSHSPMLTSQNISINDSEEPPSYEECLKSSLRKDETVLNTFTNADRPSSPPELPSNNRPDISNVV